MIFFVTRISTVNENLIQSMMFNAGGCKIMIIWLYSHKYNDCFNYVVILNQPSVIHTFTVKKYIYINLTAWQHFWLMLWQNKNIYHNGSQFTKEFSPHIKTGCHSDGRHNEQLNCMLEIICWEFIQRNVTSQTHRNRKRGALYFPWNQNKLIKIHFQMKTCLDKYAGPLPMRVHQMRSHNYGYRL